MITVVQKDETYEVRFKYDPTIVSLVKSVPGRRYNPNGKFWTIPLNNLGMLESQFMGTKYENQLSIYSNEHIDEDATIDKTVEIPDIDISNIDFQLRPECKPYQHQYDFMKFMIDREQNDNDSGVLLCDQQGLGKSLEIMMLALYKKKYNGFKHCLVICCMNNTKYHWMDDIEKFTYEQPYILGTRILKSGKNKGKVNYTTGSKEKIADLHTRKMYGGSDGEDLPYFIITNIETLRSKIGKKYVVTELLINLINSGYINMIVIDEVHKNCSPSSMQGKQLLKIKDKTGKKCMWIPMTGTPIVNRPTDVYLPLKLVDGHSYTNYWVWCQTYCIYGGYNDKEIVGYKNIENLKELLQNNMIRRLKEDTLDLPPKLYYTEYVENTKYQEHLYDIVSNELITERESIVKSLNPLSKIMQLRQVNGSPEIVDEEINYKMDNYIAYNAKLQRLLELLDEIHERGEKVLVFSNWVEPLRMIYYHLPKSYHTKCYTGTMKDSDRQEQMKKFKEDPNSMVLLGTIDSMGVSHTLTVANNIIFYDEPWTVASFEQCCDRCHRISTTKPVNIYTLITKGTIDEKVDNILYRKKGISSFIVDNIDIHSNPDLFDYLLGTTR